MKGPFPPIAWFLLSFALGIIVVDKDWIAIGFVVALSILALYVPGARVLVAIMIVFCLLGCCCAVLYKKRWELDCVSAAKQTNRILYADVTDFPQERNGKLRCRLNIRSNRTSRSLNVSATFSNAEVKNILRYGQTIRCRVADISGYEDPHWRDYLLSNGLHGFARVDSESIVICSKPKALSKAAVWLRGSLIGSVNEFISRENAGVVSAMVVGDKEKISEDVARNFKTAGLTHIVVVSGLNLSLTGGIFAAAVRTISGSYMMGAAGGIVISLLYGCAVGPQAPAWRAVIMLSASLLTLAIGRKREAILGLVYAAAIMLMINPFIVFQPGFQLSFISVLALMYLPDILLDTSGLTRSRFIRIMLVPVSAQLGLAPLLADLSGNVATYTIAANILAVPAASALTIISFLGWSTSFVCSLISRPFWYLADILASYIIGIAGIVEDLPVSKIKLSSHAGSVLILAYFGVLMAVIFRKSRIRLNKASVIVLLMMAVLWLFTQIGCDQPEDFTVTFFDVGQGDATLIQTKAGKNILIDAGDSGEHTAAKLREKRVRIIDVFIVSHPHADHINGAQKVLEDFTVLEILDTKQVHGSEIYRQLLGLIESQNIKYRTITAGTRFRVDPETTIDILGPPKESIDSGDSSVNDNSLVCRVTYDDFKILFPGDIEEAGEGALLGGDVDVSADVLKVPHHGSSYSCSNRMLSAVNPGLAVISVGADNDFGHPAPSTLVRLKEFNAQILQTSIDGDISLRVPDGKHYYISTSMEGQAADDE